ATSALTSFAKNEVKRWRPDRSSQTSFPSAHSSTAASSARLSNRNLDSIEMRPWVNTALDVANWSAVGTTAWARVEGGKHFPSDVLAGICLGNFATTLIHDSFMNLPEDDNRFSFRVEPSPSGFWASLSWNF